MSTEREDAQWRDDAAKARRNADNDRALLARQLVRKNGEVLILRLMIGALVELVAGMLGTLPHDLPARARAQKVLERVIKTLEATKEAGE
jgi:hypothetical protein